MEATSFQYKASLRPEPAWPFCSSRMESCMDALRGALLPRLTAPCPAHL